MNQILSLSPHWVPKVWGGQELGRWKGVSYPKNIGETWEISSHPQGPSLVAGKPLSLQLPYLVKLIEAQDNLSIQVHPPDHYARQHEKEGGKSECWVILGAKPGAGLYLGLRPGVEAAQLEERLQRGSPLDDCLNFIPVQVGQCFWVPAGTVHAIGGGVILAEVQQSSGITYRLWDWGRPRSLHWARALEVIDYGEKANDPHQLLLHHNAFRQNQLLLEHPDFHLYSVVCDAEFGPRAGLPASSFLSLEGEGELRRGFERFSFSAHRAYLFPSPPPEPVFITSPTKMKGLYVG